MKYEKTWQNVIWREINTKQYQEWDRELIMRGGADFALPVCPFTDYEPEYHDSLRDEIFYIRDEFGMPNDVCEKIFSILENKDDKIFLMYIDIYEDRCEITSIPKNEK